ncbi:MAG: type VI secretion system tip protein TssI/VgrG [Myxococcota bacterium]
MADTRRIRISATIDGLDTEDRCLGFDAVERLGELFEADVHLVTHEPVEPEALLNKRASIRIATDDDHERHFHGIVFEAEVIPLGRGEYRVHATIMPRLALLTLGRDCRIFQEKSIPEVIDEVLEGAGLATEAWEWRVGDYPTHENLVQYNESDFDFVQRLLQEAGISFFLLQDLDQEKVVFFDDGRAFTAVEGEPVMTDRDASRTGRNIVSNVVERHTAAPDMAMLRDYDFTRPAIDLSESAESEAANQREIYDHPAGTVEKKELQRRTQRLLERMRGRMVELTGESNNPLLEVGRHFTVSGNRRIEANRDLLLVEVSHRGGFEADDVVYETDWVAIPMGTPVRPHTARAAPVLGGPQLAFVTVPGGQELHSDDYGRVKVRFPWDRSGIRDDKSSTWLRLTQRPLQGPLVVPRKDFEVLVDYELGDIDRPFVTGRLFNDQFKPPYELPAENPRTTIQTATLEQGEGENELRFDDTKGAEEVFVHASRDQTVAAERDLTFTVADKEQQKVGKDYTQRVGGNHVAIIEGGRDLQVGASQSINVEGDYRDAIGGAHKLTVGAMRKVQSGGDYLENVGGNVIRTIGAVQTITTMAGYGRHVNGNSLTLVGAAFIEIGGGSFSQVQGGSAKSFVGGLKLVKAKNVTTVAPTIIENAISKSVIVDGDVAEEAGGNAEVVARGGLGVEAKNISIGAEESVTLAGGSCSVTMTKDGVVTIKAPTVMLKNADTLKQAMHKSG